MITEADVLKYINANRLVEFDTTLGFLSSSAYLITTIFVFTIGIFSLVRFNQILMPLFLFLFSSLALSTNVVCTLKYSVDRVRPYIQDNTLILLTTGSSPSFPSGHTTTTMVVYLALSSYIQKPNIFIMLVLLWALLVAYSRLALGAHYPSDVIAGIAIAFLSIMTVKRLLPNTCVNNLPNSISNNGR